MMKTALLAAGFVLALSGLAEAHDAQNRSNWIGEGKYKSRQGQMCCGPNDCAMLDSDAVTFSSKGYVSMGWGTYYYKPQLPWEHYNSVREQFTDTVPFTEVLPSEDDHYWICEHLGVRKCFFGPLKTN
jgi:hypothetical protein